MKNIFKVGPILIALIFLCLLKSACSNSSSTTKNNLLTVQSHAVTSVLYYTGVVSPLKTLVVPSPADGVVTDMSFQYGEQVAANQLLFSISSSKFLTDYKTALMQYVKAKNDFNTSQTQLSEGQFLHKNQLISDDDFKTKQSNFYANQLALLQAKDTLDNILKQLEVKDINLYTLTIADIDKITEAMHLKMNADNLRILAPTTGVVLAASKEDENKKIMKGDVVKQGDVLAIIGDMTGLSVRVKVNELVVNQLRAGQKVQVTGIAFPEYTLQGEIERIDRQGESVNGALPTFTVEVNVPSLTDNQRKEIHVGMSAKVEINIEQTPQVVVPLNAIAEKNGDSYVRVYDPKQKKTHEVLITTGQTTADSVTVLSNLKAGEQIVVSR